MDRGVYEGLHYRSRKSDPVRYKGHRSFWSENWGLIVAITIALAVSLEAVR